MGPDRRGACLLQSLRPSSAPSGRDRYRSSSSRSASSHCTRVRGASAMCSFISNGANLPQAAARVCVRGRESDGEREGGRRERGGEKAEGGREGREGDGEVGERRARNRKMNGRRARVRESKRWRGREKQRGEGRT